MAIKRLADLRNVFVNTIICSIWNNWVATFGVAALVSARVKNQIRDRTLE
jgi:hypothetical protein